MNIRSQALVGNRQTCGLESLYLCMRIAGKKIDLHILKKQIGSNIEGVSAQKLISVARQYNVVLTPIKTDINMLLRLNSPAILHVNGNHFIVFIQNDSGRFVFFDNEIGLFDITPDRFKKRYAWSGDVLIVGKVPSKLTWIISSYYPTYIIFLLIVVSFFTRKFGSNQNKGKRS
jgi:ABC-type bacteriocin/lantibiotic exporter with double-glycine peptidase domain